MIANQHLWVCQQPFETESGVTLPEISIAYESLGELSHDKSNAILIEHAWTGDAHVAGDYLNSNAKQGWWKGAVGEGKAFDPRENFLLCSNVIGGCGGSTGPSSTDPRTGKPYGSTFPVITIGDMVHAQKLLLDHLGITSLKNIVGASMGGMQALQWAIQFPDIPRSVTAIASTPASSPMTIALNEIARECVRNDPAWNNGDYYDGLAPLGGLATARKLGHITFLSDQSMWHKFGRHLKEKQSYSFSLEPEFEIEGYLQYRGKQFIHRFDANSYMILTRALDYFDLARGHPSLTESLRAAKAKFQIISYSSDWLYPPSESQKLVDALRSANQEVVYHEMQSSYGHDAFLIEYDELNPLIRSFLSQL